MTKKYKAIIFDMDGVVIDSEKVWIEASNIFLNERGKIYDNGVLPLVIGKSKFESAAVYKEYFKLSDTVAEIARARTELVGRLLEQKVNYKKDFISFFERITAKYQLSTAIATGSSTTLLKVINKRLNLNQFFGDHIYSVSEVDEKGKPDPAIFLYAANKLAVAAEDCIVIEDSPLGIEAAKRAKMFAIGLSTTVEKEIMKEADVIVDSLLEIDLRDKLYLL